jgi:hypothetical protein
MASRSDDHDHDVDADAADADDDVAEAGRPADGTGWRDRIRSNLLKGASATERRTSTKSAIEKLDDRERRFSFIASGASLVFGVMIYVLDTNNPHFRLAKGQITPQTLLVLGIACAALLLAATFYGRRALVGFVALLAFLMFGTYSFFVGAPFLALAAWLLYRSYQIQKQVADERRAAKAQAPSAASSASRSATSRATASSAKSSKARSGGSRDKGPAKPEANKRYTPKRPPPPAPKPSRRERKATQATD